MKLAIRRVLVAVPTATALAFTGFTGAFAYEATTGFDKPYLRTASYTAPAVSPFADITSRTTFYTEIAWMAQTGISTGWNRGDGTAVYKPHAPVLREQMAAFLYRSAGSPNYTPPAVSPFTDVSTGHTFYKEIAWLAATGISTGWNRDDGTAVYKPHAPVLREQMAAFLYRLAGEPPYGAPATSPFTDLTTRQGFYKEMAWLAETGISTGWVRDDGTAVYRPSQRILRDQMAAFLFRLYESPGESADEALGALRVAPASAKTPYDRDAQYGGWIDVDGDCADTRNEILARDLTDVVSSGCIVLSGTLFDPYTGQVIDFVRGVATSAEVQIDHVVALGAAHRTGGSELPQQTRVAFANDPLNLLAVDGPTNGSKSDKDASEWLPPNEGFRCAFVARQIAVKVKYELWVTVPEKTAMAKVLSACPNQALPGTDAVPDLDISAPAPAPLPAPAPAPAPAPVDVYYANCTAARDAGAAPLYRGQPGYRNAMDRDNDGVACE